MIPSVFPGGVEEIQRRYQCISEILGKIGLPLYDDKIAELIKSLPYYSEENK